VQGWQGATAPPPSSFPSTANQPPPLALPARPPPRRCRYDTTGNRRASGTFHYHDEVAKSLAIFMNFVAKVPLQHCSTAALPLHAFCGQGVGRWAASSEQ
jgi:hypothetical protein